MERYIFSKTNETIHKELTTSQQRQMDLINSIREMENDGDLWDDVAKIQTHEERERLVAKESHLKEIIRESKTITRDQLEGVEEIRIGHEVSCRIKYPDGDRELTSFTLGTSIDSVYLNNSNIVSVETPIGRTILGAKTGEVKEFEVNGDRGKIEIISFSTSILVD